MRNLVLILISIFVYAINLSAQSGKIQFENTTFDYGDLREEVGAAHGMFTFKNIGNADLKIVNVKTSCGCTASEYSKGVIKPGESGYVKATYSTTGRPGPFRKTITVTTNDVDNPNTVLFIKGNVFAKGSSEADKYPIAIGNLKLINNHLAFNETKSNEIKVDSLKIFNNWDHEMSIRFDQVPPFMKVTCKETTLDPQASTYIIVEYNAALKSDFGLVYDQFAIITDDIQQPVKTINISANITEDFSKISAKDLKKAPKIVFNSTDYSFDKVKSGDVVVYKFTFTNAGKKDLIIRKTKASCGCTAINPELTVIKKGKSSFIEVKFDTRGYGGPQHKTVTVITNDPNNPIIVLNIHGEISK